MPYVTKQKVSWCLNELNACKKLKQIHLFLCILFKTGSFKKKIDIVIFKSSVFKWAYSSHFSSATQYHVTQTIYVAFIACMLVSRCQNMLQKKFGPKSRREKIPPLVLVRNWEVPLIVDQAGLHRSMSSTVSLADQDSK